MFDTKLDVVGWSKWLAENRAISSKLLGASRINGESYFLAVHAATESMLRRILLIGLRLNKVTYDEANEWLYHNDDTPDNEKYPRLFDQLYQSKHVTWIAVIRSVPGLDQLWDLWLGYSKTVRNHISHGIRKYNDDWLHCGITIDQEILVRLNMALTTIIGGSVCADLTKLNPRLPIGLKGSDLTKITARKPRKLRPSVSLVNAKIAIEGLIPRNL